MDDNPHNSPGESVGRNGDTSGEKPKRRWLWLLLLVLLAILVVALAYPAFAPSPNDRYR
jgi:hypothetical protein